MSPKKRISVRGPLVWFALSGLVVGAGLGTITGATAESGPAQGKAEGRPVLGGWPDDADGDGVVSDQGQERIPQLIRAVGDKGIQGYVKYQDYVGSPEASSPEEALKMPTTQIIPVYASDGVTVVDQLTLSSGPHEAQLVPGASG